MRTNYALIGALPAFALMALLISGRGFGGEMVFDSQGALVRNLSTFETGSVTEVLQIYPPRPLSMLAFYLNYVVTGLEPYCLRMVNAFLQAFTAFSLFVLMRTVVDIKDVTSPSSENEKTLVTLVAALAYLVHPVQSFLTLYVIQRMAILACLFCFLSVGFYVATRTGKLKPAWLGYGASVVFFLCGLLSKEISVTIPLFIILAEVILFRNIPKLSARNLILAAVALITLFSALDAVQKIPGFGATGLMATIAKNFRIARLHPWEAALSQCRMLFHYVWLTIAPFFAQAPLVKPMVISRSLVSPLVTLPAVLGAGTLVFACVFLVRKKPLTAFGIGFFLTALIPEAVAVPQNLYFPQRAALPMAGAFLVLVDWVLACMAWGRHRGHSAVVPAVLAIASLLWLGLTINSSVTRAAIWRDPILVWKDSVDSFPRQQTDVEVFPRVVALNGLGETLREAGKQKEAIAFHQRALRLEPRHVHSWQEIAAAYWQIDRIDDAINALDRALILDPRDASIRGNLGALLLKKGRIDEAIERYQEAVKLSPTQARYRRSLAFTLLKKGKVREAVRQFEHAVELQREGLQLAADLANLGKLLLDLGKTDAAIVHLKKATSMADGLWQAHHNLGVALVRSGRAPEAVRPLQRALAINPNSDTIPKDLEEALTRVSSDKPE